MLNIQQIESKWQKNWEQKKAFQAIESKKKKFYCLEMYSYPSGSTLHMGHAVNYTIGDVYARFKRMQGFNVLHPTGFDSFGLPAENAAIENKSHPKVYVNLAIKNYIKFMKKLGFTYDFDRLIYSHDPNYYKWNQWLFTQMFKKNLAYKKKSLVNWCKKCNTVLANEQVIQGKCWRHNNQDVEQKNLDQWFFKVTKYQEELLKDLDSLDWPEEVKQMQRNWIGKSKGVNIFFKLDDNKTILPAYTTRPDTIYSVTFLAIAPENPIIPKLIAKTKYEKDAIKFVRKIVKQSSIDRTNEEKEKEGFFTGRYAINPVNNEKIPIYIANFALMYGSGIVMCDAHDKRDFKFAKKYKIPLKFVISKNGREFDANQAQEAFTNDGILFNSGKFSGLNNREALPKISNWLQKNSFGEKTTQYKLRDWLISRQRYWGTPIPIIYCSKCGTIPVPEEQLPVLLPEDVKFSGKGNPIVSSKSFLNVKCPKCNSQATRETDTMDTFMDSSWYFLRFTDPKNNNKMFSKQKAQYWMPMDLYIGGKEHATLHLIYSRFITKVLRDLKLVNIGEPAKKLFNQGMLHNNGVVMSKSKGNTVTPDEISEKYGIDTARLFLLSISSPDKDKEWSDSGIKSTFKTINKYLELINKKHSKTNAKLEHETNKAIKLITKNIENMKYNIATIALTNFINYLHDSEVSKKSLEVLAKISSPFTPHLAEELYSKLGNKNFVSSSRWPKFNKLKYKEEFNAIELLEDNINQDIQEILKLLNLKPREISLFVSESWKYPFYTKLKKEIKKTRKPGELISKLKVKNENVSKIILSALKDESKLPLYVIPKSSELKALKKLKELLEVKFDCKFFIRDADKTSEIKAKKSSPLKPAIVVTGDKV